MSDQFKPNQSSNRIQAPWNKRQMILSPLYHKYVPAVVRHRKNVAQVILQDVTVLALVCWQVTIGIEKQCAFYRVLSSLGLLLPKRSRFNRICQQAGTLFNLIRNGLPQDELPTAIYTVIDSIPMPFVSQSAIIAPKCLVQPPQLDIMRPRKYDFKASKVIFRSQIQELSWHTPLLKFQSMMLDWETP